MNAIYNNEAVTETMFSACPEYRLQTLLVMCAKLFKKNGSLGAHLDYGEHWIEGGGVVSDRVKAWKSQWGRGTHTHTNQVGSREPFNTHLRPRLKRQSTSSPGSLQHRASPHAPPNFTHRCTPVEVFYSGFWCLSAESYCSRYIFLPIGSAPRLCIALKSEL